MIIGIIGFILSSLGIYGFYSEHFILMYIGMIATISEHIIGIITKQARNNGVLGWVLAISIFLMLRGMNWLVAISICLCFENVIMFALGSIMMIIGIMKIKDKKEI